MQVQVIAASNHGLWVRGEQLGVDHWQREHVLAPFAFTEVMSVIEEQVAFLCRQLQTADETIAVEHVTHHDWTIQWVATEHFRVHGNGHGACAFVQLDNGVRQYRCAQIRIGHFAADHVRFLAADIERMAEEMHDAYT
ncbi:hypothetical protein D3C76_1557760 [compost metagenome]